jgi:hypothetical protein
MRLFGSNSHMLFLPVWSFLERWQQELLLRQVVSFVEALIARS